MNAVELLQAGHKIRRPSWWWGNFITGSQKGVVDQDGVKYPLDENNFPADGWEIYEEEKHGKTDIHPKTQIRVDRV